MKANGVPDGKANIMYWVVRTFGPSWKVVKKAVSSGIVGPSTYRLSTEPVNVPEIPEEKLQELIDSVGPELDVSNWMNYQILQEKSMALSSCSKKYRL